MTLPTGPAAWFGLAGVGGILAAAWQHIRSLLSRMTSVVIVNIKLDGRAARAASTYLFDNYRRSRLGKRWFTATHTWVAPLKKFSYVAYEYVGSDPIVFWKGWLPILLKQGGDGLSRDSNSGTLSLTFLRGTLDVDRLIIDVVDEYNSRRSACRGDTDSRVRLMYFFGSGGKATLFGRGMQGTSDGTAPTDAASGDPENPGNEYRHLGGRPLKWKLDELGSHARDIRNPFEYLILPPDIMVYVEEAKQWLQSRSWYESRNIPWRRGWLLHGPPGCGKSSLARALSYELNLPVGIFDLSSMNNSEFVKSWRDVMVYSPCIVLIEDIDAVFLKRQNRLGDQGGGLTFDCVLNCISGVDNASGIFTIITTNHLEDIDPALGTEDTVHNHNLSSRPGRIDRIIELNTMNDTCRRQLIEKILVECPEYAERVYAATSGTTGAQVQELCSRVALAHKWKKEIVI
jgi:hypothetical protein